MLRRPDRHLVYKDAVYFSMHKFIGGPQTPGVLVAKRSLFKAGEAQPSGCGGGTVFFVGRDAQVYLKVICTISAAVCNLEILDFVSLNPSGFVVSLAVFHFLTFRLSSFHSFDIAIVVSEYLFELVGRIVTRRLCITQTYSATELKTL